MVKRFREEDLEPIASTGRYAGQKIRVNQPDLTHKSCREWTLCCPECYQFVHLRKSEKIKSYFAHYDVEDKNCKYRVQPSSNNNEENTNNNGNQGQDLEGIQNDLENIILNYIKANFELHQLNTVDDFTVKNCIKHYLVIVNNENDLREKLETKSYDIVKTVFKILSIDMNRAILNKLIRYGIDINNSSNNSNHSNRLVENTVEFIIKIITDIDWTRDKTKSKILENNEASEKSILCYVVLNKAKIPTIKKIAGIKKRVDTEEYLGLEVLQSTIIDFLGDNNARKIGVNATNNKPILVYGLGLAGISSSCFHLCDLGIAEQRVIVSFKRKKLAAKYPASEIEKVLLQLVYQAVSSWSDARRDGKFLLHFGVLARIWLSSEYQEIIQNTRFTYDSLNVLEPCSDLDGLQDMLAAAEQELQELGINSEFLRDKLKKKKLEHKFNSAAQDKLRASTKKNNTNKVHFPEIPLYAKKIANDIMVWIRPSDRFDIYAYIDWSDLSQVTPSNPVKWHSYGVLKVRRVKNIPVIEFRVPNNHRNFASNYKLQDGKHTATHYISMALSQWSLRANDLVMLTRAEFQGKELKERPLYCKELCKYLGLHLKPKEMDGNVYIQIVKDERECKATNDFKAQNPSLKNVAHNVYARTTVKVVKSAALDKVDNTEKIKERIIDEVSKEVAKLLHPGIGDSEVMLPDGKWLKPKYQFIKGVKRISGYYLVKRETVNTWHS